MGKECECVVRFGKQKSKGKALLETSEVIFRGAFRLKLPFATLKSVKSVGGELRLGTPEGVAVFELGEQAAKWCDKILHPKTRIEKLGVKVGARVVMVGDFDRAFLDEVNKASKVSGEDSLKAGPDLIFFKVEAKKNLVRVPKLAKGMAPNAAIWVVYPKGRKEITEVEIITVGRNAGLKDVKVVGFSATHTGLKFVVPLDRR